jgi:hypothetical protein
MRQAARKYAILLVYRVFCIVLDSGSGYVSGKLRVPDAQNLAAGLNNVC